MLTTPPIFLFLIVLIVSTSASLYLAQRKRKNRKSPLNVKLLRQPGESLQNKIHDLDLDIIMCIFAPSVYTLFVYAAYLSGNYYSDKLREGFPIILQISAVIATIYAIKKAINLITERNNLRVGLESERAVGDELNRITSLGCIAFHDFPSEKFNIDHILISSTGIYAIETKGRSKQTDIENNWKVKYQNNKLIFPSSEEVKPIYQARAQAQWLSAYLSKKLRETIPVKAVLAIPGWFIEINQKPKDIIITNGKNLTFLTKGRQTIPDVTMLAVSNIIEEKCKNVGQMSYQKIQFDSNN